MNAHGLQWVGWAFFSVSALAFIIAAWRAGDLVALLGALAFMAANLAFMLAHTKTHPAKVRPLPTPEEGKK